MLKRKQKKHKKLAQEVVGVVRDSSWKDTDVVKWQKEVRKDR